MRLPPFGAHEAEVDDAVEVHIYQEGNDSVVRIPFQAALVESREELSHGPEEVPAIPGDVPKDDDPPVRLVPRFAFEDDASRDHRPIAGVEILNLEE